MISSAEEFLQLRTSQNPSMYSRSSTDQASLAVWLEVISMYPSMKRWVALNKTIQSEVIEILACDPDVEVRAAIAMKRSLSADLFEKLSKDEDPGVRERLAYNKKTPPHVIYYLLNDSQQFVRDAATKRAKEIL